MDNYRAPLPKETTEAMFSDWLKVIERHECASIISLPFFDRHYRVPQFLEENKKLLPKGLTVASLIFQSREEFLGELKKHRPSRNGRTLIFVMNAERLLTAPPDIFPKLQEFVLTPYRQTSLFFFFERNILYHEFASFHRLCPVLIQNIFVQPLYLQEDIYHFLRHMEGLYGVNVGEPPRQEILKACGGYIYLSTQALRRIHSGKDTQFSKDEFLELRLHSIWAGFTQKEQETLKQIVFAEKKDHPQEIVDYFYKSGLVEIKKGELTLTVPILGEYIKKQFRDAYTLEMNEKEELTFNSVNVSTLFSGRERYVLKYFLNHPHEQVSREQVGEVLFGKEAWEEKGSDWALDQAMKRLRNRLKSLGNHSLQIETVKGKGFIWKGGSYVNL